MLNQVVESQLFTSLWKNTPNGFLTLSSIIQVLFSPYSHSRIYNCFITGKRIEVWNCHATCGHRKTIIFTSRVYERTNNGASNFQQEKHINGLAERDQPARLPVNKNKKSSVFQISTYKLLMISLGTQQMETRERKRTRYPEPRWPKGSSFKALAAVGIRNPRHHPP
jgi:hypothetical protein